MTTSAGERRLNGVAFARAAGAAGRSNGSNGAMVTGPGGVWYARIPAFVPRTFSSLRRLTIPACIVAGYLGFTKLDQARLERVSATRGPWYSEADDAACAMSSKRNVEVLVTLPAH